jgi:hypothetical protein
MMWNWRRKPSGKGFPERFRVQRIDLSTAKAIAELPPFEIAAYFREHPRTAGILIAESGDIAIQSVVLPR